MSMNGFQVQLLALLTLLHRAMCADATTEVIRAVGASVTFHIQNLAGDTVFWSFGSDPIASVVVKGTPVIAFSEAKYKKRFTFPENGRTLSISQLSLEDAGTYSAKTDGIKSTFTLHVYRELTEPTVTCEAQNCSAGSCRFSLRCSALGAGLGNVSYFWSWGERPWDEGPTVLVVNKSSGNEPGPLTCTARNPVSSRNVTVVTPGGLCAENAAHPPGPGALFGSPFNMGLAAGIGVVVSSLIVVFVLLRKSQGRRKSHLSEEKTTDTVVAGDHATVYAEVGPPLQSIPNGIKAKPREAPESCTTVYSLVKRPGQEDDGKEANATMGVLELV